MGNNAENFFQEMTEKISLLNEEKLSKLDFLEDLCRFFDISHAFIYESDPMGIFYKKEHFEAVYKNLLPDEINVKEVLGVEMLSELSSKKVLVCSGDNEPDEISEKITAALGVKTLIFVPILNQHFELAGFVGLGDKRKIARHGHAGVEKSCALISLLAANVKLEIFRKGIENTEQVLSNILDNLGIDIYVNDFYTHDVLYANKSMAEPYGGVENMVGKKCWESIYTDKTGPCDFCPQTKLVDEDGLPTKSYTWDYERPFDKSWFSVISSSFNWTDGKLAHLVASVDITEKKRNQMIIENLAKYDHLTGLPNRRTLQDDIDAFTIDNSKFGDRWFALFCDLDGFKKVNDTLGHAAGDVLLTGISHDLSDLCSDDIKAYRQGGDEFVVLIKDHDDEQYVREIITKLFVIFREQYIYDESLISCDCSIGVAHYPTDASTANEIFHLADNAMYNVKKAGRGMVRFCSGDKFLTIDEYYNERNRTE